MIILEADKEGVLRDPEDQSHDAVGHMIEEQGAGIPDEITVTINVHKELQRPLQVYFRPYQSYTNKSSIKLPETQGINTGLNPKYLIHGGQKLFHGLPTEHLMDHIEMLEDFTSGDY